MWCFACLVLLMLFLFNQPDPVIWVDLVAALLLLLLVAGVLCAHVFLVSQWQLPSVIILPSCQDNNYRPTLHATHIASEAVPAAFSLSFFFLLRWRIRLDLQDKNMRITRSFTVFMVGLRCAHSIILRPQTQSKRGGLRMFGEERIGEKRREGIGRQEERPKQSLWT